MKIVTCLYSWCSGHTASQLQLTGGSVKCLPTKMPTRYVLKIPCPISGCAGQSRLSQWVCARDNGTMYVDEDGYLSCYSNNHRAKIIYWKFDCGERGSGSKHNYERYQSADLEGFSHAMAIGLPHLKEAGAVWVTKLIQSVENQFINGDR